MVLAFIVGAVLGGLLGGLYMRYLMYERSYQEGIEHNRRMQELLNGQYNLGIQKGISEAKKQFLERDSTRDNMLVTAGAIAGYLYANGQMIIHDENGDGVLVTYITNVANNYHGDNYGLTFKDYIKHLLIHAFGVRQNG